MKAFLSTCACVTALSAAQSTIIGNEYLQNNQTLVLLEQEGVGSVELDFALSTWWDLSESGDQLALAIDADFLIRDPKDILNGSNDLSYLSKSMVIQATTIDLETALYETFLIND